MYEPVRDHQSSYPSSVFRTQTIEITPTHGLSNRFLNLHTLKKVTLYDLERLLQIPQAYKIGLIINLPDFTREDKFLKLIMKIHYPDKICKCAQQFIQIIKGLSGISAVQIKNLSDQPRGTFLGRACNVRNNLKEAAFRVTPAFNPVTLHQLFERDQIKPYFTYLE